MIYFELVDVIFLTLTAYAMGAIGGGAWFELRQISQKRYGFLIGLVSLLFALGFVLLTAQGDC